MNKQIASKIHLWKRGNMQTRYMRAPRLDSVMEKN